MSTRIDRWVDSQAIVIPETSQLLLDAPPSSRAATSTARPRSAYHPSYTLTSSPEDLIAPSVPSLNLTPRQQDLLGRWRGKEMFTLYPRINNVRVSRSSLADSFQNRSWIVRPVTTDFRPVDQALWGDRLWWRNMDRNGTGLWVDTTRGSVEPYSLNVKDVMKTRDHTGVMCDFSIIPSFGCNWSSFHPRTLEHFKDFVFRGGDPSDLRLSTGQIYTTVDTDNPEASKLSSLRTGLRGKTHPHQNDQVTILHRDGDGLTSRSLHLGTSALWLSFDGTEYPSNGPVDVGWSLHVAPQTIETTTGELDEARDDFESSREFRSTRKSGHRRRLIQAPSTKRSVRHGTGPEQSRGPGKEYDTGRLAPIQNRY